VEGCRQENSPCEVLWSPRSGLHSLVRQVTIDETHLLRYLLSCAGQQNQQKEFHGGFSKDRWAHLHFLGKVTQTFSLTRDFGTPQACFIRADGYCRRFEQRQRRRRSGARNKRKHLLYKPLLFFNP
jgi:hypothetical protein